MTNAEGRFHPFGRTQAQDLALIARGEETGWWDENGHPAPWPQDFLDPDAGWTNGTTYATGDQIDHPLPELTDPDTPPF